MKSMKSIVRYIVAALAVCQIFPVVAQAATQEELLDKINLLEIQIQQLKELRAQQNKVQEKEQDCIKSVGMEKFCKCLAEALPDDIGFEQYIHGMVSSPAEPRDDSRKRGGQENKDAVHAAHDKCVQKGLLW